MKTIYKIFIIILIVFSLLLLSFQITAINLYKNGLKALPDNINTIFENKGYENFNKLFWKLYSGNTKYKIKPINFNEYVFLSLINSTKSNKKFKNNGWKIAYIVSYKLFGEDENYNNLPSLDKKIACISATIWISRHISAEDCINLIAHKSYFGNGFFGIDDASNAYFKKNAEELNEEEIIYLLTILEQPSRYNPLENYDIFYTKYKELEMLLKN